MGGNLAVCQNYWVRFRGMVISFNGFESCFRFSGQRVLRADSKPVWLVGGCHSCLRQEMGRHVGAILFNVFFFNFVEWGDTESTWYVATNWPVVPAPDDR
jgi:hypothetical protein